MADRSNRIHQIAYETVYPMYVKKVEGKNRTKEELDKVLTWLTGDESPDLLSGTYEEVYTSQKSKIPDAANQIKGVICGVRVEELTDPVIRFARQMDKLVDELAKGKAVDKVIRTS